MALRESKRNDDREWCGVVTNRALGSKIIRGGEPVQRYFWGDIGKIVFWLVFGNEMFGELPSSIGRKISIG